MRCDTNRRAPGPLRMALIGCLALALCPGCDRDRQASAATSGAGAQALPPAPAPEPRSVAATSAEPILRTLDSHLMVERNVGVTTRRDGQIEEILADRGQHVRQNDELARLDSGDLVLAEKAAALELEKEQASHERARRLLDQAIIPAEEYEQARLRRDAAEKSLERIRYELSKCTIRAPFDGVVSGRYVEKGQVVLQDDRVTLFQVTALRPLLARIYVPEWALFGLSVGQSARVSLTAAPERSGGEAAAGHPARVRWINDVVDAASGSVEALVQILEGPDTADLRPGLSVAVSLDLAFGAHASGRSMVSLPREAIPSSDPNPGDSMELKVISTQGQVIARAVVLGLVGDHRVEVRSGLQPGEKVLLPE